MLEQAFQFLRTDAYQAIERLKTLFNHKRFILAGKPLRTTKRRPTGNNRQSLGHCRPPSRETVVLREKKTHLGQSLGPFTAILGKPHPEALTKSKSDANYLSHSQLA